MMMAYGKDYEVSYIVSINFRANLDAQNAGNCISGLQISNIFWGSMPPDPTIISQKGPVSKNAPPPPTRENP